MEHTHNGKTYSLRTAPSKRIRGYIYHVLSVGGCTVEVPCLDDGHSIARMFIDGELSLSDEIPYTPNDEVTPCDQHGQYDTCGVCGHGLSTTGSTSDKGRL